MPDSPLSLDARTTALVLIDLQKGIVGRELSPHSSRQVVDNAVRLATRCNETGAAVVLVHVAFSEDGADRLQQPVDSPMATPAGGLPPDWAEFAPQLDGVRRTFTITKHQWGA